jgi:hypothetical protein
MHSNYHEASFFLISPRSFLICLVNAKGSQRLSLRTHERARAHAPTRTNGRATAPMQPRLKKKKRQQAASSFPVSRSQRAELHLQEMSTGWPTATSAPSVCAETSPPPSARLPHRKFQLGQQIIPTATSLSPRLIALSTEHPCSDIQPS